MVRAREPGNIGSRGPVHLPGGVASNGFLCLPQQVLAELDCDLFLSFLYTSSFSLSYNLLGKESPVFVCFDEAMKRGDTNLTKMFNFYILIFSPFLQCTVFYVLIWQ